MEMVRVVDNNVRLAKEAAIEFNNRREISRDQIRQVTTNIRKRIPKCIELNSGLVKATDIPLIIFQFYLKFLLFSHKRHNDTMLQCTMSFLRGSESSEIDKTKDVVSVGLTLIQFMRFLSMVQIIKFYRVALQHY